MKRFLINIAFFFQLPVVIIYGNKRYKGYLSTNSKNPFGKFYLHEQRKKIYLGRVICSGNLKDIASIHIGI